MSTVLTGEPVPELPVELQPVIRIRSNASGVDAADRRRKCYAAFHPRGQDVMASLALDGGPGLLAVPRADQLMTGIGPERRATIRRHAVLLMDTLGPYLLPPLGQVQYSEFSCLPTEQEGFAAGTVTLVRSSDQAVEQYVFPHLRVDRATGDYEMVSLPARRPIVMMHAASGSGIGTAKEVLGAVMAVTPFLPPPWGPISTGLISFANLMLGLVSDTDPNQPSPFDQLKQAIEDFIVEDDLRKQQGQITQISDHYTNQAGAQRTPIDKIKTVDGGISDLKDRIVHEFIPGVDAALGDVFTILSTRNTENFTAALDLQVSGVTLFLMLQNAKVTIGAVTATVAKNNKDAKAFDDATSSWIADVGTAASDLGTSRTGDWDSAAIQAGLKSTAYIPKIEAWMAKAKADRLAKISDLQRYENLEPDPVTGDPNNPRWVYGWTFTDSGLAGDGGYRANLVKDTSDGGCGSVEHKDQVSAARDAHIGDVAAGVDNAFASYRTTIASWTTFIEDFHELLPPDTPMNAPTVSAQRGGPAVPKLVWVSGANVRYAVAAVNKQGPSASGPWSAEYTVGDTAFTTLDLTPVKDADSLYLYRQIQPPGGSWGDQQMVAIIPSPLPATFDDVNTGEENW